MKHRTYGYFGTVVVEISLVFLRDDCMTRSLKYSLVIATLDYIYINVYKEPNQTKTVIVSDFGLYWLIVKLVNCFTDLLRC